MTCDIKKIMVTINTDHEKSIAVNRAVQLAKIHNAEIHLVTGVYDSVTQYADLFSQEDYDRIKSELIAQKEQALDDIADDLQAQGFKVVGHVRWDANLANIIDEMSTALDIDLVVKRTSEDLHVFNPFSKPLDQQIVRQCHAPLLLVKEEHANIRNIVVAVDPTTPDPTHQALNQQLVMHAQHFAQLHSADIYYINAYEVPVASPAVELGAFDNAQLVETVAQHHQQAMAKFATEQQIDKQHYAVVDGLADTVIADYAQSKHADLVLLGTVGRTGLSGFFIGNTAEEVMSRLDCEVLTLTA